MEGTPRDAAGRADPGATPIRALDPLTRLHGLLGIWLGGYLLFHLWEQWPALAGREAWLERMRATTSRRWEIALVLVPFATHVVLGLVRALRDWNRGQRDARGLARLQALTGVGALLFVVHHVRQVWSPASGPHTHLLSGYAALRHEVGRPIDLVLYVVGISCIAFHLAHGLVRLATAWGGPRSVQALRLARYAAGLAGFALWLALLHLLGHFAIGEGLVPLVN